MALIKELKGSFVGGKVSKPLQNRTDLEKFNTWLSEAKNTQIKPEGSISNRAGTIYIGTAKESTYRLIINVNVSATIIINGQEFTGKTAYLDIPTEDASYTYEVSAVGYEVLTGSGTLTGNNVIDLTLEADATQYTFTITNSQGATITINEVEQSTITADSGTLIEWSVEKEGYISQSGSFLLSEDKTLEVELEAITNFVLSINTTPNNANVKVIVNDEVVFEGISPANISLDSGDDYLYEISLDGYITETGGGVITEDTTITTTLQESVVDLTNLKPTIKDSKPTTYTVSEIYTYNIKKTGPYKIMLGGSKGHSLVIQNYTHPETKGGTAVLQETFTNGDVIKVYRIDGGYIQYNNYGGSGIGIKLNDEWLLVVGGGGMITFGDNNYASYSGGGGYIGGKSSNSSALYQSKGRSADGTQGNGTGNTNGSGATYSDNLGIYKAYGGTGYIKTGHTATLTTGNNNNEGYAKIEYIG